MSQGQDSLRAIDTIYMFPFNGKIQPGCCPCVTCATVPCCTSRWSAMDLLRWAHLFPHGDDITLKLCWESERDLPRQRSNQQLAQWNTKSSLEFSLSCHHVAQWREHEAWYLETRGFILKTIQWHIHAGSWSLVNCWREACTRPFIRCSWILIRSAVGLTECLGLDGDRCIRVIPRHVLACLIGKFELRTAISNKAKDAGAEPLQNVAVDFCCQTIGII